MGTPENIISLLQKIRQNQPLAEQEKETFRKWFHAENNDDTLFKDENWEKDLALYLQFDADDQRMENSLKKFNEAVGLADQNEDETVRPIHRVHFLRKWSWAAAIILLAGAGSYFYFASKKTGAALGKVDQSSQTDIAPGSNKALLTLSDGSTITLDNAANGAIAQQGNASIIKLSNGELRYDLNGLPVKEVMMNTMSTPRGGQYQLVLPDGSKVWLNAASSITYPAAFAGNNRKVKVTGEVYMEVAQNKAKPFIVDMNGQSSVEVLGTTFNINSYADEGEIKTTLINGSVRVISGLKNVILKSGYQAVSAIADEKTSHGAEEQLHTQSVNINQVLAWKNGIFDFNDVSFQSLVKDVERWYDIQVKYEGKIPSFKLEGKMDRGVQLTDLIRFMKQFGLNVELKGRTLIISER